MAPGAPAVGVQAALRGRQHIALVFNGAGAQQQFPVRLAGGVGEGGGYTQYVAGWVHQRTVELGEAQVIADRQPHPQRPCLHCHGLTAGHQRAALVVTLSSVVKGKEVDLVVVGSLHAIRVEHAAAVQHLALHGAGDGQRAAHHPQAVLTRRLRQEGLNGRRPVTRRFSQRQLVGVASAQGAKVLGQQRQLRARRGRLRHQALGAVAVAGPVGCGHHLQGGDLHAAHGKRQGKADIPRLAWAMGSGLTSGHRAAPARMR